jgi:hypothetical protein
MRSVTGHEKKPFDKGTFLSSRRSSSSTFNNANALRGIHINISSDPFQHRIPPYIQRLWQESKLRKHLSVWKRRLTKRYQQSGWLEATVVGVCIFMGCLVLLIHVGFFSGKKYQDWQHDHYHADKLDEVDLLDKVYSNEGRAQTTAILLLRNNNKQGIESVLEQLCQYDMFASFTIWNDDPNLNMTIDVWIKTVAFFFLIIETNVFGSIIPIDDPCARMHTKSVGCDKHACSTWYFSKVLCMSTGKNTVLLFSRYPIAETATSFKKYIC